MITGIPTPGFNTFPWPKVPRDFGRWYFFRIILITALNANCPRQRIVLRSLSESISLVRYVEHLRVSSMEGLFPGGAHLTAAVTYVPFSTRPSSKDRDVGWLARPDL